MTDRVTDLRKTLAATTAALEAETAKVGAWRDDLAKAKAAKPVAPKADPEPHVEILRLSDRLAMANEEIDRLKVNLKSTADLANAASEGEAAAKRELAVALAKLDDMAKAATSRDLAMMNAKTRIKDGTKDISEKDAAIASMGQEIAGLRKKLARLAGRDQVAKDRGVALSKAEKSLADLRKQAAVMGDQLQAAQQAAQSAYERGRADVQAEATATAQEVIAEATKSHKATVAKAVKDAKADGKASREQDARKIKDEATAKLAKAKADAKAQGEKHDAAMTKAQGEIDHLREQVAYHRASRDEAYEEVKRANKEIERLKYELAEVTAKMAKQDVKISEIEGGYRDALKSQNQAQKVLDDIRREMREARQ